MALEAVHALLFDVFGTVVDWRSGIAREAARFLRARRRIGRARGPSPMRGGRATSRQWRRCGAGGEPLRAARSAASRKPRSHLARISGSMRQRSSRRDSTIEPAPGIGSILGRGGRRPGLARLKARFIIAPLSNGNIALMLNMAKIAPACPGTRSSAPRSRKPTSRLPEAYLRTADVESLRPEEICMVAAHNSDLAAAQACGLQDRLRPPREPSTARNRRPTSAPEGHWDVTAADFGQDLAQKVGA